MKIKRRLTGDEKDKILNSYKDGLSIEDIAAGLKRPVKVVDNYLQQIKSLFHKDTDVQVLSLVEPKVIRNVLQKLIGNMRMTKASANAKILKIISQMNEDTRATLTEETLYNTCLTMLSANDIMVNTSAGGAEGITAMTEGASSRSDFKAPEKAMPEGLYPINKHV